MHFTFQSAWPEIERAAADWFGGKKKIHTSKLAFFWGEGLPKLPCSRRWFRLPRHCLSQHSPLIYTPAAQQCRAGQRGGGGCSLIRCVGGMSEKGEGRTSALLMLATHRVCEVTTVFPPTRLVAFSRRHYYCCHSLCLGTRAVGAVAPKPAVKSGIFATTQRKLSGIRFR